LGQINSSAGLATRQQVHCCPGKLRASGDEEPHSKRSVPLDDNAMIRLRRTQNGQQLSPSVRVARRLLGWTMAALGASLMVGGAAAVLTSF
jgi:hypothetical protein